MLCEVAECKKPAMVRCAYTVSEPRSYCLCLACNQDLWEQIKGLVQSQVCSYYALSPVESTDVR